MRTQQIARVLLLTALLGMTPALAVATDASPTTSSFGRTLAPAEIDGVGTPEPACETGVVKDDGSLETGFGWVPSVIEGEYVQTFHRSEFPSPRLETVCVCWLRTRPDDTIDFEVVFYEEVEGEPDQQPFAVVPAQAQGLPSGVPGGRFYAVDVSGVELPDGTVYIGPRWDASADQFFFVCDDTTATTPFTNIYFRDDRSEGEWDNAADTIDPIFAQHRALLIRAVAGPAVAIEIPTLSARGVTALSLLLLAVAWIWGRRR